MKCTADAEPIINEQKEKEREGGTERVSTWGNRKGWGDFSKCIYFTNIIKTLSTTSFEFKLIYYVLQNAFANLPLAPFESKF